MADTPELLPCPFCGNKPCHTPDDATHDTYIIECMECEHIGLMVDIEGDESKAKAIAAWNARAAPPVLDAPDREGRWAATDIVGDSYVFVLQMVDGRLGEKQWDCHSGERWTEFISDGIQSDGLRNFQYLGPPQGHRGSDD